MKTITLGSTNNDFGGAVAVTATDEQVADETETVGEDLGES